MKEIKLLYLYPDMLELYGDYVESDSYTDDICWSGFEDRSAEEILNR